MLDRQAIVRYWERRRWWFLVCLIPPTVVGYLPGAEISAGVGDREVISFGQVLLLFLFAFVLANVAYTFIYAIEFLVMGTKSSALYEPYRFLFLIAGTLLGMVAAYSTAVGIYFAEYGIDPVAGAMRSGLAVP